MRQRDPAAARARIISAAHAIFESNGFGDTSIDAIAARARLSKRTIYECFSDKHAILEAVLADFSDAYFREIALCAEKAKSSFDKLFVLIEGMRNAALDGRSVAMARIQIAEAPSIQETVARVSARGLCNATELLRPLLIDLGVINVDAAAHMFYDLFVLAPLHRRLTGMDALPLEPRHVTKIVLAGLSTPSSEQA